MKRFFSDRRVYSTPDPEITVREDAPDLRFQVASIARNCELRGHCFDLGDGDLHRRKSDMGTSLKALLPSASTNSTRSIWSVAEFIPGLQDDDNPQERVFQTEHSSQIANYLAGKRLGSPVHYRFYFALTGPRTVLPDDKINELKSLAGSDIQGLTAKLIEYIRAPRPLGQSWLEHVIDRFSLSELRTLSVAQLTGLATAVTSVMEIAVKERSQIRFHSRTLADKAETLAGDVLDILRKKDPQARNELLQTIFAQSPSLSWLVASLFRQELFDHGVVGDRAKRVEEDRHLTADELNTCRQILQERLAAAAADTSLQDLPDLPVFFTAGATWRGSTSLEPGSLIS
jgi:hypothetical protein